MSDLVSHSGTTFQLEEEYKIAFSRSEVCFLHWLHVEVVLNPSHRLHRLLELCTFHAMMNRHERKLGKRDNCKLKLTAADVLALKRILLKTPNVAGWKTESDSLLFTLDQLTVGIR